MKIGVLTYFWDENPGTILQAYCLTNALKQIFPDAQVELINYQHARHIYLLRNYLKVRKVYEDYQKKNIYGRFKNTYLALSDQAFISRDYRKAVGFVDSCKYDAVVVGSDTVWQITRNKKLPSFPNAYWLPGAAQQTTKATFAVSANITRADSLTPSDKDNIKRCLEDFTLIGVRDSMTFRLVEEIYGSSEKLSRVPDPTFAYDPPYSDVGKLFEKTGVDLARPVLAINYPARAPFCREIVDHYRTEGFQIVSLTTGFPHADHQLPCLNPFQWANMFRHFSFVITDRFHGAIFSLKNNVPVLAVDWHPFRSDKEGNSKTFSLMSDFGIEKTNHLNLHNSGKGLSDFIDQADRAREDFDKEGIALKREALGKSCSDYLHKLKTALRSKAN